MDGFEGLWFECETGDEGITSTQQVGYISIVSRLPAVEGRRDIEHVQMRSDQILMEQQIEKVCAWCQIERESRGLSVPHTLE